MSKIKNKIRQLEAKIILDRQLFIEEKNVFFVNIYDLREELYVASLLFAGLSFGYAMGPGKGSIMKRITSAAMFLVNTSQLTNQLSS